MTPCSWALDANTYLRQSLHGLHIFIWGGVELRRVLHTAVAAAAAAEEAATAAAQHCFNCTKAMFPALRLSLRCFRMRKILKPEEQKYHTSPISTQHVVCVRHQDKKLGLHRNFRTPVFCVGSLVRDKDAPPSVLGAARPSNRCSANGLRAALAPAGSPWKDFFTPGSRPGGRCGGRPAELAKSTWFQSCKSTVCVERNAYANLSAVGRRSNMLNNLISLVFISLTCENHHYGVL